MGDAAARTGLQLVGTVVGSFIGGPIGGMVGGAIGGAAGWYLFPEEINSTGPRLSDLQVQDSNYGGALPIVFGNFRVAGNVIWADEIRETQLTEDVGGKGGPTQTVTTFKYTATFAVAICEGEIGFIRRIWADSRPEYDLTDSANAVAIQASAEYWKYITFYHGDETQTPDATIEAILGVGNVPAYRGVCYVVFRDLPLANYGNRIPNLSFEVCQGTPSDGRLLWAVDGLSPYFKNWLDNTSLNNPTPIVSSIGDVIRVTHTLIDHGVSEITAFDLDGNELVDELPSLSELSLPYFVFDDQSVPDGENQPWGVWRFGNGWGLTFEGSNVTVGGSNFKFENLGGNVVDPITGFGTILGEVLRGIIVGTDEITFILVCGNSPFDWYMFQWNGNGVTLIRQGTVDDATAPDGNAFGISPVSQRSGQMEASIMEANNRWIWQYDLGGVYVWEIDDDDVMYRRLAFTDASEPLIVCQIGAGFVGMNCSDGICAIYGSDNFGETYLYLYSRMPNGDAASVTVGDIINSLCLRTGLDSAQIDTSTLTEVCDGFAVGATSNARAAIESLSRPFYVGGVESGDQLRFYRRGGAPVAEIESDDFGAGDERPAATLISSTRAQETELPSRLTLRYASHAFDYQQSAQSARRATTLSRQVLEVNVPVSMSDDRAAQAADILMAEAWAGRTSRQFYLSRKWSLLEPGDVVQLNVDDDTYSVMITRKIENRGLMTFDAVDVLTTPFESTAVGAPSVGGPGIIGYKTTRLEILDIPVLRDVDDNAGLYSAAAPIGVGRWGGATVFRRPASAGAYVEVGSILSASTMGFSISVLGDFDGGNIFDETNYVDVTLTYGDLASISELDVLNFGNAAMLGDEMIQFRDVDHISGNDYRLSGLLRGRKGTEAGMLTHTVNERFVVLSTAATRRIVRETSDVNSTAYYRPLTFGGNPQPTSDVLVTNTGAAIKPLSPVHIVGTRLDEATNDDVTITWVRRARLTQDWLDLIDVPLDELVEAYEVDIYDALDTNVLRTLTVTGSTTVLYTEAQQIADFGAVPNRINVRVYQMSQRAGRGFPGVELLVVPFPPFSRDWADGLTTGQTLYTFISASQSVVSGKLRITSASGGRGRVRFDNAPQAADFTMAVDIVVPTGAPFLSVEYRTATPDAAGGSEAFGLVCYSPTNGSKFDLRRGANNVAGGTPTVIGTWTHGFSAGDTVRVEIEVSGTSHIVRIDGTERINVTDGNFVTPGYFCLMGEGSASDQDFDNLLITY